MINSPNPPNPPQPPQRGYAPVSPGDSGRTSSGDDIRAAARNLGEEATTEGREQLQNLRGTAAENVDKLAHSAQAAASTLREDDIGHLSEYVSDLATRMSHLSSSLRTRSGDEILHDVGRMARENPALFVTGSIALGFGLARFARASQQKAVQETALQPSSYAEDTWSPQTGTHDYAASRGTTGSTTAYPVNPAAGQTGTSAGTEGGIH